MPVRSSKESLPDQLIADKALRLRKLFETRRFLSWGAFLGFGEVSNSLTLRRILQTKGGTLFPQSFVEKSGYVLSEDPKMIGLVCGPNQFFSLFTPDLQDNFAIAKQLGHYFLHTDRTRAGQAVFTHNEKGAFETEANFFAMTLLMPAAWFVQLADKHGSDARQLASIVGTRPQIVQARLYALRNG